MSVMGTFWLGGVWMETTSFKFFDYSAFVSIYPLKLHYWSRINSLRWVFDILITLISPYCDMSHVSSIDLSSFLSFNKIFKSLFPWKYCFFFYFISLIDPKLKKAPGRFETWCLLMKIYDSILFLLSFFL